MWHSLVVLPKVDAVEQWGSDLEQRGFNLVQGMKRDADIENRHVDTGGRGTQGRGC